MIELTGHKPQICPRDKPPSRNQLPGLKSIRVLRAIPSCETAD